MCPLAPIKVGLEITRRRQGEARRTTVITQPMAGPCELAKLVTQKARPKVDPT